MNHIVKRKSCISQECSKLHPVDFCRTIIRLQEIQNIYTCHIQTTLLINRRYLYYIYIYIYIYQNICDVETFVRATYVQTLVIFDSKFVSVMLTQISQFRFVCCEAELLLFITFKASIPSILYKI